MARHSAPRSYAAPVAFFLILLGLAGAAAALLGWQSWLVDAMNDTSGLAAWVQAVMSVAAIGAGFIVLLVQSALEHKADQANCRDQIGLMASVADACADDFDQWITLLARAEQPLGRPMSQPHLFVAVEGLMFRDVGAVRANRLMIDLRKIIQDVWWQIETADEVLRGKLPKTYYPDCMAELRRLAAQTRAIKTELESLAC